MKVSPKVQVWRGNQRSRVGDLSVLEYVVLLLVLVWPSDFNLSCCNSCQSRLPVLCPLILGGGGPAVTRGKAPRAVRLETTDVAATDLAGLGSLVLGRAATESRGRENLLPVVDFGREGSTVVVVWRTGDLDLVVKRLAIPGFGRTTWRGRAGRGAGIGASEAVSDSSAVEGLGGRVVRRGNIDEDDGAAAVFGLDDDARGGTVWREAVVGSRR